MQATLSAIEQTLLMGPGPSCVAAPVYEALALPTIGHLDPRFIELMDAIKAQLQTVMQTTNRLTIPLSGTGSAGMEAAFVNLIEPGDRVLVLINGVFGMRMQDVATRLGAQVDTLEYKWGTPVIIDDVVGQVSRQAYKLVALVHAETSTGVCNPAPEIGAALRDRDCLFLLDTVTSLGGMPVAMDAWGVDVLYSGTQKCLSCPPGLAPLSFSAQALEALDRRTRKVPNWYLDLEMIVNYWQGATRAYHHTAPINMLYGLHAALGLILDEGLEGVFKRHADIHHQLVAGLENLGLEMLVNEDCRLPMLNAVRIPQGVDEALVRRQLLEKHRIEIGAGLGPLAGSIWRVGTMGHTAQSENVDRFLAAFSEELHHR